MKWSLRNTYIVWSLVVLPLLLAIVVYAIVAFKTFRPPQYDMLYKTLGKQADDPKALLQVFDWQQSQYEVSNQGVSVVQAVTVKHLALLRLLDLQVARFNNSVPPPSDVCLNVDHHYAARVKKLRTTNIIVQGTPSLLPDQALSDGPYWSLEVFEFTPEGRLVSRRCVSRY